MCVCGVYVCVCVSKSVCVRAFVCVCYTPQTSSFPIRHQRASGTLTNDFASKAGRKSHP